MPLCTDMFLIYFLLLLCYARNVASEEQSEVLLFLGVMRCYVTLSVFVHVRLSLSGPEVTQRLLFCVSQTPPRGQNNENSEGKRFDLGKKCINNPLFT